ncbi:MAG: hypothetical protein ABEJ65_05775 [bacterium]
MTIYAILASILVLIIAVLAYKLWELTSDFQRSLNRVDSEIVPLLRESRETMERVNRISGEVERHVENTGDNIDGLSRAIRSLIDNLTDLTQQWKDRLSPDNKVTNILTSVLAGGYDLFKKYRSSSQSSERRDSNE